MTTEHKPQSVPVKLCRKREPHAAHPWIDGSTHVMPDEGSFAECPGVIPDASWPEKCRNCGASQDYIGFDYADGFNCRKCGASDADE